MSYPLKLLRRAICSFGNQNIGTDLLRSEFLTNQLRFLNLPIFAVVTAIAFVVGEFGDNASADSDGVHGGFGVMSIDNPRHDTTVEQFKVDFHAPESGRTYCITIRVDEGLDLITSIDSDRGNAILVDSPTNVYSVVATSSTVADSVDSSRYDHSHDTYSGVLTFNLAAIENNSGDNETERRGRIKLTLLDNDSNLSCNEADFGTYVAHKAENTVAYRYGDPPIVSIYSEVETDGVIEGDPIPIRIVASYPTSSDGLKVNYRIGQTDHEVDIPAGERETSFMIENESLREEDETNLVIIRLRDDDSDTSEPKYYTVSNDDLLNVWINAPVIQSEERTIIGSRIDYDELGLPVDESLLPIQSSSSGGGYYDYDYYGDYGDYEAELPTLSIQSSAPFVNDGDSVQFTVSAEYPVYDEISLKIEITDGGENERRKHYRTVVLAPYEEVSTAAVYFIPKQDRFDENRSIRAEIVPEPSFNISPQASKASVFLIGQSLPVISIESVQSSAVPEGGVASFRLVSLIESANDVPIRVRVSDDGNGFLSSPIDTTVVITGGEVDKVIDIRTTDDFVDRNDGPITAEVINDRGYNLASKFSERSSSITVTDNDVPAIAIFNLGPPVVSEDAGTMSFFVASSDERVDRDLTIRYRVEQNEGNFLDSSQLGERTVVLPSGDLLEFGIIEITLIDDNVAENNGEIVVSLLGLSEDGELPDDATYVVTKSFPSATIIVEDNDTPVVSVAVLEQFTQSSAGSVQFEVSSNLAREGKALEIGYTISGDNSAISATGDHTVTLPVGGPEVTAIISVPFDNEKIDANNSMVTVTLKSDTKDPATYTVSEDTASSSASVEIIKTEDTAIVEPTMESADPNASSSAQLAEPERQEDLPLVSISVDTTRSVEGEVVRFQISVSLSLSTDLVVDLEVDDGDKFVIFGEVPDSITIDSGTTHSELQILTEKDDKELEDVEVTVSILPSNDYVVNQSASSASVVFVDSIKADRIARFLVANNTIVPETLTAMGNNITDELSSNVKAAFEMGQSSEYVISIAGQSSIGDLLLYKAYDLNNSTYTLVSLLEDSSFRIPVVHASESDIAVSAWGSGDYTLISESSSGVEEVTRSGELYSARIGLDAITQYGFLVGTSSIHFNNDVEFSNDESGAYQESSHKMQLNGLHPYIAWTSDSGAIQLWTSAGFGQGSIKIIEEEINREKLDASYHLYAFGNSNSLYSSNESILGGTVNFTLRNEAWSTGMNLTNGFSGLESADYSVHRARVAMETSHSTTLASDTYIDTNTSIGMRWDEGDDQKGLGLEMGASVGWNLPFGLEINHGGRILMQRANLLKEWGLNGDVQFDTDKDNVGVQLLFTPTWGDIYSGSAQQLWETGVFTGDDYQASENYEALVESEVGYGFHVLEETGTITPYGGAYIGETGVYNYTMGTRFTVGADFNLVLEYRLEPPRYEGSEYLRNLSIDGTYYW